MDGINTLFLLMGILLFISVLASTLSARLGLPLLLMFLFVGMLAGENGPGGIQFGNFVMATLISQLALAVILLDGGLRTRISSFRIALKPASVLASWGVIATVLILGLFVTLLLGVDWKMGLLMAAIVGSTDAAAVFSLLRNSGVRLHDRVQSTLEIESGANDPMAILLVMALIGLNLKPEEASILNFLIMLVQQIGFGLLLGAAGGWVLSRLVSKVNLAEGLYALLIVSGGLLIFAATNLINGSGFLAVYLAGIMVGNRPSYATEHVLRVMDGLAWLAQAGMFLILGLLVTPERLLHNLTDAVLISMVLIFVARPLAIVSTLKWFNFPKNEMAFISWVGLRGAVPVTLAILPVMMGVPDSRLMFDIGFTIVLISLLVQGATIAPMAKLCKVELPPKHEPIDSREIWVGEKAMVPLQEYCVDKGSEACGSHPDDVGNQLDALNIRCFALVRDGDLLRINPQTKLQAKDHVWYSVPNKHIEPLATIFDANHNDMGVQAQFFGEFNISPDSLMADLSMVYGIALSDEDKGLTAAQLVRKRLNAPPAEGDKVALDGFYLIIKSTQGNTITTLGLKCP